MKFPENNLALLEAKVGGVVFQRREQELAYAAEKAQRTALMDAVLNMSKPALPSIVGKITTASLVWADNTPEKQWSQNGLRLAGEGPRRKPNEESGVLQGRDVFWLLDGSVLELLYAGSWSVWDKVPSPWHSEATLLAAKEAASYLVSHGLDEIAIRSILDALDAQLKGNTPKRIVQARARAEKLRAILALME
jgi:hypothetical protein